MEAMIMNDEEKEWMLPLLDIRNSLDWRVMGDRGDKDMRDFRRMSGKVQLFNGEPIHGPYRQSIREKLLRSLLEAQEWIRQNGPEEVRGLELITLDELSRIRAIWVEEKHELEDSLPQIFNEATGRLFPDDKRFKVAGLGFEEMEVLKGCCGTDEIHYQLVRELLHVEWQHTRMTKRSGLTAALEKALEKGFYEDEDDAKQRALERLAEVAEVENHLSALISNNY